MTTYILLRSNKENGPFNLEQLREMDLKPNDLIWVEGQSASWRNPQEIKELKELLTQEPKAPSQVAKTDTPATEKQEKDPIPAQPGKSSVFVALPEKQPEYRESLKEPKPVGITRNTEPREEKSKEEVETKYAMSLDEIKQRYINSLEERKRKKLSFSLSLPKDIRKAAVYIGLVGFGAFIVILVMRAGGPVAPMSIETKRIPGNIEQRPATDNANTAAAIEEEADIVLPESYYDTQSSLAGTETVSETPANKVKKPAVADPVNKNNSKPATEDEHISAREEDHKISVPKNEIPEIKPVPVNNLAEKISVKTNQYTIAALGGIRDLELTLRNDSEYTLDKVTVEVRFLNPNGNIVKTEDVHFKSIQPSGSQTIGMKKTNRGVKVSYRIIRIESKEVSDDTAGMKLQFD